MKKLVRLGLVLFIFSVIITGVSGNAKKKKSVKLNKSKVFLWEGQFTKLKINTKKKVKWTSQNKKVATVSKAGKVLAKKAGDTSITAKVGKRKYNCKVIVEKKAEIVSVNEIFTKELYNKTKKIVWHNTGEVVTNKRGIKQAFVQLASVTLTEVPENEPVYIGALTYDLIMEDNSVITIVLNKQLVVNGKRYNIDKDIAEKIREIVVNYAEEIKRK